MYTSSKNIIFCVFRVLFIRSLVWNFFLVSSPKCLWNVGRYLDIIFTSRVKMSVRSVLKILLQEFQTHLLFFCIWLISRRDAVKIILYKILKAWTYTTNSTTGCCMFKIEINSFFLCYSLLKLPKIHDMKV